MPAVMPAVELDEWKLESARHAARQFRLSRARQAREEVVFREMRGPFNKRPEQVIR
jgi:hypothetical protein